MIFRPLPLKAAVVWDGENHADLDPVWLLTQLQALNILAVERHAYADWRSSELDRLAENLRQAGFTLHQAWSGRRPGALKNTADGYMARGIIGLLAGNPTIEVVVIVSGDAYFVETVRWLHQQGRTVIVAADPLRASRALRTLADAYLPLGRLAHNILEIDRLERLCPYLTFSFVLRKTNAERADLEEMIRRGILLCGLTWRPGRGVRPEIWLNRQAYEVRQVLNAISEVSTAPRIIGRPAAAQPGLPRSPKEMEVQQWGEVLPAIYCRRSLPCSPECGILHAHI